MKRFYRQTLNAICIVFLLSITTTYHSGGLNAQSYITPDFQDDFESGPANWALEVGWTIEEENGNHFLQGTGHHWARLSEGLGDDWSNYGFRFRTKIASGAEMHANFYVAVENDVWRRYFLGIHEGGLSLNRQVGNEFTELVSTGYNFFANQWHTIGMTE